MSLKTLKKHLLAQDYRMPQLDEVPETNNPDFVQATIAAANKRYAREARQAERKAEKIAKNSAYGKLGVKNEQS